MNFDQAKRVRELQLAGGHVSANELREAMEVLKHANIGRRNGTDPWKMSNGMRRALEAYIETGTSLKAAELLGANPKTTSMQLTRARDRMGKEHVVLAALAWVEYQLTHTQPNNQDQSCQQT